MLIVHFEVVSVAMLPDGNYYALLSMTSAQHHGLSMVKL